MILIYFLISMLLVQLFTNNKHKDCIGSSGETWIVLRKVIHTAIQKYAANERLPLLVSDCVKQTFNDIIAREGVDQEFSSHKYIQSLVINILGSSLLGEWKSTDDQVFKFMDMLFKSEKKNRIVLWAFSPIIRLFDWSMVKRFERLFDHTVNYIKVNFQNHSKDYVESIERDFCDALITAKLEAIKGGKHTLKYLTDENMSMLIFDLFFAGSSTTTDALQWSIILMTYYPEFQQMIRQEIENQIGDRIATLEDAYRCHFLLAFISETLRFRVPTPTNLPHSTTAPARIGDYLIPEGKTVLVFQDMILTDEKYWTNGRQFIPQRFLKDGEFVKTRNKAYIPFSTGRRVCPGDKFAMADILLIIINFLQLTKDYDLVLGTNGGLAPDPYSGMTRPPTDFKIILKSK